MILGRVDPDEGVASGFLEQFTTPDADLLDGFETGAITARLRTPLRGSSANSSAVVGFSHGSGPNFD